MNNNEEPETPCGHDHSTDTDRTGWPRVFVHETTLPHGLTQPPTEVIARTTMTLEQLMLQLRTIFFAIQADAPIVLQSTVVGLLLPSAAQAIERLIEEGKNSLGRAGVEPIDMRAEQLRAAREVFGDPDTPDLLKESLQVFISQEEAGGGGEPDSTWPDVVGSDLAN